MGMPISELVAKVGDDNITLQNISHCLISANNGKKQATITFATSPEMCGQMMKATAGIESATHIGLLLWIPRNKLPPVST